MQLLFIETLICDNLTTRMLKNSTTPIREIIESWKSYTTNGISNWEICCSHRRQPIAYGFFGKVAVGIYNALNKTTTTHFILNLADTQDEQTIHTNFNSPK